MSPADRWDEIARHLDAVGEHLRAIRRDAPPWAQAALLRLEDRMLSARRKVEAVRKVVGG